MSLLPIPAFSQQAVPATTSARARQGKRVLWTFPNSRTSPSLGKHKRLNAREKCRLATLDAFDRGTVALRVRFATILHQDSRHFRRGTRCRWSGRGYAAGQIFWTRNDSDGGQFNLSEIAGNSTTVARSMAYYPGNRDAADVLYKLGSQPGVDMASNILKEFWPDLEWKDSRKNRSQ